jgi:L,D-peptidoglycan transpeptidase YkuD (ErfK/YbiS/YcfS/YnhG family)
MPLRRLLLSVLAAAALPGLAAAAEPAAPPPAPASAVPNDALQLVVVVSSGWDATDATLLRFERAAPGAEWLPVGPPKRGVLGRTGMAWGRGLHRDEQEGAEKWEGDGATPAGIFRISSAFGAAPRQVDIPFTVARPGLVCVTDKSSRHYNRVVDLAKVPMRWDSDEPLLGVDETYELAVVIDQNPPPIKPGRGSCTFIHGWKGTAKPTNGSVAILRDGVEALVAWLDAQARPVVVLLPWPEYRKRQKAWSLPVLQAP